MRLESGHQLQSGKYRIISVLGQGGFGITYLAENILLGKQVAIKEFFPKDFCGRNATSNLTLGTESNRETVEKLKARFLKEARNIAKLDHPGIVRVFDVFEENDTAYYVMEYIHGENLNEIVKRNGPFPEDKAVEYILKVGEALDYIHSKNMTHLDVKPANIIIRKKDDLPILIDFGLSKQYDNKGDATSTLLQAVSHGYSPIELYNAGSVSEFSPQTDIYSLGATLYYMLTGIIAPNAVDLANNQLSISISTSEEIQELLLKCLCFKIEDRFSSMQEFFEFYKNVFGRTVINSEFKNNEEIENINNENSGKEDFELAYDFVNTNLIKAVEYWLNAADKGFQRARRPIMNILWDIPKKEFNSIFNLFLEHAVDGSIDSEFILGYYYFYGGRVNRDYKKSYEWLERAALKGHPIAQIYLGIIYEKGLGVPVNLEKAIKWYEKAAAQNVGWAMNNLADIYFENDLKKSLKLYRTVIETTSFCEQEYLYYYENPRGRAHYMMGIFYYKGLVFISDRRSARIHWMDACDCGYAKALKKPFIRFLNFLISIKQYPWMSSHRFKN